MTDYIKKIRVALYIRVSTQEQAKEGYSIGEQIDRLKKYADVHDYVVVKIYTDAGQSGGSLERPALQEMIYDIEAGKIDKVCVYKLDRLSRSQKDTMTLLEDIFLTNKCDFESMTEKFDTATSFGRAMIGILSIFAQLERENIKERMSMGIDARIKKGKWRGGQIPFGYDYEPTLDKLVINEYEAMIVKYIFNEYTEGKTANSIQRDLINKGYTFKNGSVDRRTIRYILKNKTYCGYQKNKDQWLKCNHDTIIDENTFDKAQKIMEETYNRYKETGYKNGIEARSTNLGGLIYCVRCGAKYSKSKSGSEKYGFHLNYSCYSRHKKIKHMIKDPNCKNKIYRVDYLDNLIFNEIKKLAVDPEYINVIKKEAERTDEVQRIHAIEHQIKTISGQISRFMDLYGIGKFSMEELDEKTVPLQEQKYKLQKELKRLQENSKTMTEDQVFQLVESFEEALNNGDLNDRRSIIEQLINRIDIDGEDITIHWNFI